MKQVYPVTIQSGAAQTGSFLLMLLEPVSERQVPIIVGPAEAQSILMAKERVAPRRPMTHELMKRLLEVAELTIDRVTIDRVFEGVFYSTLHVVTNDRVQRTIDARPSDAIALALLTGAPIYIDDFVLEETSVKADLTLQDNEPSLEALERELQQCEETEDYERAAEIQKQIEQMKGQL